MSVLEHVHGVGFRGHVILLDGFLVCVGVKKVRAVRDKRRVFLLAMKGRSEGVGSKGLLRTGVGKGYLRLVVSLLGRLACFWSNYV